MRARVKFLTAAEGGRSVPPGSGYAPTFFDGDTYWSVALTFDGESKLGAWVAVDILFPTSRCLERAIQVGEFALHEGSHRVAVARLILPETEVINWSEDHRDLRDAVGHAIISMMTEAAQGSGREWEPTFGGYDPRAIEIDLRIFGVRCSFKRWIEKVYEQVDRTIEKRAGELLDERLTGEVSGALHELDALRRRLRDLAGLPEHGDDDD